MLRWAIVFLAVALIAALFGYGGIAGEAAGIARVLFFVCLLLFLVALAFGWGVEGREWNVPPPL